MTECAVRIPVSHSRSESLEAGERAMGFPYQAGFFEVANGDNFHQSEAITSYPGLKKCETCRVPLSCSESMISLAFFKQTQTQFAC